MRTFWKSIEKNELIVKKIIDCDEDDGKYGYEFRDIGIITMILSEDLDHVPERKFISRKNKEVDIRLRINYKKFVESDENQQFVLYVKNIIDSIKVVNGRKKGDFNGEKLIDDILSTLGLSLEKLAMNLKKLTINLLYFLSKYYNEGIIQERIKNIYNDNLQCITKQEIEIKRFSNSCNYILNNIHQSFKEELLIQTYFLLTNKVLDESISKNIIEIYYKNFDTSPHTLASLVHLYIIHNLKK